MEPLRVLSLGAGVQSTTLALMAAKGEIGPMPDCAVFADTQNEPIKVYKHLEWLNNSGILPFPIYIVTRGNLREDALKVKLSKKGNKYTRGTIPAFTENKKGEPSLLPRGCTGDYKIAVIHAKVKELVKARYYQDNKTGFQKASQTTLVEMLIGISKDEAVRMKDSRKPWIKNIYPLVDARISRVRCLAWLEDNGFPRPPRSACTFCPYHSNEDWLDLQINDPIDFQAAVEFELLFQVAIGESGFVGERTFLHPARMPLSEIDFKQLDNKYGFFNNNFGNECEGMCGV